MTAMYETLDRQDLTPRIFGWSDTCDHSSRQLTGREETRPFLFFWSDRFVEYRCPDCGKIIWEHD